MLHVISQSPFSHTSLKSCLDFMQAGDQLLLIQDAVIASTTARWAEYLQDREVYILQEDLAARGLENKTGILIDMKGFVTLVIQCGSPLCW